MTTRPTVFPDWALVPSIDPVVGGPNVQEPSQQKKDSGWYRTEYPAANIQNWLHNIANEWIKYFDDQYTHTGDIKYNASDSLSGWVPLNNLGTIGSSASSATIRANDDTENLFKHIWDFYADAQCPLVPGPRGASAQNDWDANKAITLPEVQSRAIGATGSNSNPNIVSRTIAGEVFGIDTTILTVNQLASHDHDFVSGSVQNLSNSAIGTDFSILEGPFGDVPTTTTGNDEAHTNIQATIWIPAHMKL